MDGRQCGPAETGSWQGPTPAGTALAGGLVVIAAVVAAPQFVLDPRVLAAALLLGAGSGVTAALLAHYRSPSRGFLVLSIPLGFLGVTWLRATLGLAPPTLLVGVSAVVVAGTVTDRVVGSR